MRFLPLQRPSSSQKQIDVHMRSVQRNHQQQHSQKHVGFSQDSSLSYSLHFGDCDLVIDENFQSLSTDLTQSDYKADSDNNMPKKFGRFYLNGDQKMADKLASIVVGKQSAIHLFSNDKNSKLSQGKVKKVEIWTFEKKA